MPLPTEKTKPVTDPMQYTICLYGPGGIGKSTWASSAPDALFVATEKGLNSLNVYEVTVDNWEQMRVTYNDILGGKHKFKTIVVDTIDHAYYQCLESVCSELGITYPYGKLALTAWGQINNRFRTWVNHMCNLPYGVVFIGHSREQEIKGRTGDYTYTRLGLPDTPRHIFTELMDIVILAGYKVDETEEDGVVEKRVIRSRGTSTFYAKDRTGRLPDELPLDYAEFMKAFTYATKATKGKTK